MMKKSNTTVGYHGVQIHILPPLLHFTNMMCKKLLENWLIGNNRDNIHTYCLMHNDNIRHVKTKKCNNYGNYKLRRIKVFMKVINKHAREYNL